MLLQLDALLLLRRLQTDSFDQMSNCSRRSRCVLIDNLLRATATHFLSFRASSYRLLFQLLKVLLGVGFYLPVLLAKDPLAPLSGSLSRVLLLFELFRPSDLLQLSVRPLHLIMTLTIRILIAFITSISFFCLSHLLRHHSVHLLFALISLIDALNATKGNILTTTLFESVLCTRVPTKLSLFTF